MKTVKALVAFSNGVISMEQYEVRELPTDMANDLIAAGICVEAGGGSGGGVLVVNDVEGTLDKTWNEIYDAMLLGGASISADNPTRVMNVVSVEHDTKANSFNVVGGINNIYKASSASGYPALSI